MKTFGRVPKICIKPQSGIVKQFIKIYTARCVMKDEHPNFVVYLQLFGGKGEQKTEIFDYETLK